MIFLNIGDSYSYLIKLKNTVNLSAYSCNYQITQDSSGLSVVAGDAIATTYSGGDAFMITLLPTISETLTLGETYTVAAQLYSNDGLFRREVTRRIKVINQAVS